jgi:uncharacterized protein (DUF2147 family)
MRTLILSGTILLAATASAAAQSADPVGEWLVEDGSARIKVVSCPAEVQNQPPTLWGVIWAETKPGTDTANPDRSMKGRPMLGVPILINMKQTQANLWSGKIYDARSGSLYDSKVSLSRSDMLEVRGCVAGFLCGGQDWKRVTGTNTPPVHVATPASPAPQAKGAAPAPQAKGGPAPQAKGAMAQQPSQTKGMATKGAPPVAAAPAPDPICSNVASLVPRG